MNNAIKSLTLPVLLFALPGLLCATDSTREALQNGSKILNAVFGGGGHNGGENSGGMNQEPEKEVENEEAENYPFKKETSPIDKDEVIGLKIKANKKIYLSKETTFYEENSGSEEKFSNLKFFSQYPNLMSIEFNGLTLSSEVLENIYNFIGKSEIKNIVFNSCILEDEEDVKIISDLLVKLGSLVGITIKFFKTTKKSQNDSQVIPLSPEGIEKITQTIAEIAENKKGLSSLNFVFDKINENVCGNIAKALAASEDLIELSLGWTSVDGEQEKAYEELSETLSKLQKLKTLCVSIMEVPGESMKKLFSTFSSSVELNNLTLFIGNLRYGEKIEVFEHAEALEKSLEKFTKLKTLRMENMDLPGAATQAIFQAFSNFKELEYLNFSGNTIDKEGAAILGDALKEMEKLDTLLLRSCNIDTEAFGGIASGISSLSISILGLGLNKIGDAVRNLQVSNCDSLICIDLANNEISSDAITSFVESTSAHETLKLVDLRGNYSGDVDRDKIEMTKSKNKSTITYLMGQALSGSPEQQKNNGELNAKN